MVSQGKEGALQRTAFLEENRNQQNHMAHRKHCDFMLNMHQLDRKNGKYILERKDKLDVQDKSGMVKTTIEFKCS